MVEELTVTVYPMAVREELIRYGYKPTDGRVKKVINTVATSAFSDVEGWVIDAVEWLEGQDEEGLGERDG